MQDYLTGPPICSLLVISQHQLYSAVFCAAQHLFAVQIGAYPYLFIHRLEGSPASSS